MINNVRVSRILMGRLPYGADILDELSDICIKERINLGWVQALGAVQRARLAFYNQQTYEYQFLDFDGPLEIASLVGNVSVRDNQPFIHAHVTLTDEKGNGYGGHLALGTVVFACEFILQVVDGPTLKRSYDVPTGLHLWKEE